MKAELDGDPTDILAKANTLRMLGVEVSVVQGPDRGQRIRLSQDGARIGTAKSATLLLTDPTVSRVHCELSPRPDGVRLVDRDSTNGTFIDGCRIRDADLRPGALVCVGATTLRIDATGEPAFVDLSPATSFGEVLGGSAEMRRIYALLEKAATTDATVLIGGETGTGKELAAQALHDASRRAEGPFVTIDCGAIPETLIESELFGHVRGAFSGAVLDRKGVLEDADGGTLFFDEIGELPVTMQPKLLRALESRQVRRIGSNQLRRIDVRVIAATNRSLARSVNQGTFREDLYYRLAVIEIEMPPLRARREDIPMLAAHFMERFSGRAEPLPPELLSTLLARDWPGNVRELRNFLERTSTLGWPHPDGALEPALARGPVALATLANVHLPLKEARLAWTAQFESVYVRALLEKTRGNVTRAAELAGVSRRFLQRTMARNGIRSSDLTPDDDEG